MTFLDILRLGYFLFKLFASLTYVENLFFEISFLR